jgi:hypothetical protein
MMQREGFSIQQACQAIGLSRAGFYRRENAELNFANTLRLDDICIMLVISVF